MIALDTNVLIPAHREDAEGHDAAYACLAALAEGTAPWAIPWPCLHEFLAIATHPRIFAPPTPLAAALEQVEAWLESPSLVVLSEGDGYWPLLRESLAGGQVTGPIVHDGHVAAICRLHRVRELWTVDRDFGRFPELRTRNPLVLREADDR